MKRLYLVVALLLLLLHGALSVNVEVTTKKFSTPIYNKVRKFCMTLPAIPLTKNFTAQLQISSPGNLSKVELSFFEESGREIFYNEKEGSSSMVIDIHKFWDLEIAKEVGSLYGRYKADSDVVEMTLRLYVDEKELLISQQSKFFSLISPKV